MTGPIFSELPVNDRLRIWWSFTWRGLVIGVCSTLAGAILGGVAGGILGAAGRPQLSAPIGAVLGLLAGFLFFYVYVAWILRARLGRYRLQLVPVEAAISSSSRRVEAPTA